MTQADKRKVREKLTDSLAYCDSHHMPSQRLFEEVVDEVIGNDSEVIDGSARQREMKALFPVLSARETQCMVPTLSMRESSLAAVPEKFLATWFERWVGKYASAWHDLPKDHVARDKGAVTDEALIRMVASPHFANGVDVARE